MFNVTFEVDVSDYPLDRTPDGQEVIGIYHSGDAKAVIPFIPFKGLNIGILEVAGVRWEGANNFRAWCRSVECLNIQTYCYYSKKKDGDPKLNGRYYNDIEELEQEIQKESPFELVWKFRESDK